MSQDYVIYTKKNDCRDCYKCVRSCPVKAIKIEDGSAKILPELCIACGSCYKICPQKAKQMRNDLSKVKLLLEEGKDVYISLAPSWIVEFEDIEAQKLITALRRLGFRGVSQTSLGAQEVSLAVAKELKSKKDGLLISTACPSSVEYIKKYLPNFVDSLTQLSSPLLAHCKMIKQELGKEAYTVFVGPCIAKKLEADENQDLLYASLSFSEIKSWIKDSGIIVEDLRPSVFDKFLLSDAKEGNAYPIEGGMIETIKPHNKDAYLMQVTGVCNIKEEFDNLKKVCYDKPIFIEVLACSGGCVNGPCISSKKSGMQKRLEVLSQTIFDEKEIKAKQQTLDISTTFNAQTAPSSQFDDKEIKDTLAKIGKYNIEDEINCGGCGYHTCKNFAKALLEGKAEKEMCVSYIKSQAQKKANALIRCIPNPIVIADKDMNIIEYNDKFVSAFYKEDLHQEVYDKENLVGSNLRDFIDFTNIFSASLDLEQDITKKHVKFDNRVFDVVVFNIDKKQTVGGLIEDVTNTELKKEQIAQSAKEVISKNLHTVQQIACTLGEHMAETEVLLRAIAKDFAVSEAKKPQNMQIKTKSQEDKY